MDQLPLTDDDLKADFACLQSVPAIANRVPPPGGPNGEAGFE